MAETVRTFKEGDRVRDSANLGGQVLEAWGNGVKVAWRNGHTGWIDQRFLHLDDGPKHPGIYHPVDPWP